MSKGLISFNEMPPERHRELSAKGGRASGVTRRRKALLRAQIMEVLWQNAIHEDVAEELRIALDLVLAREKRRRKAAQRMRTKRVKSAAKQRQEGS